MGEFGEERLEGNGGPTQDDRDVGVEGVVGRPGYWYESTASGAVFRVSVDERERSL